MTTALIVDDSRSARLALSKLLAQHGVDADEAPSAEAALEYLKLERPDVVFLDHTMPGMDGFEALDAIKAKPETTTIPVMMYTSQEGQLYVSQARALGAVGVLPKGMRPADVKRVLCSLHLIEDPDRPDTTAIELPQPLDRRQVTELVRELLYEQTAVLRNEMHRKLEQVVEPPVPPPPSPDESTPASPWPLGLHIASATSVLALTLALVSGYFYYQTYTSLDEAHSEVSQAAAETAVPASRDGRPFDLAPAQQAAAEGIASPQTWLRHLSISYPFDAVPLDDTLALQLGSLFADLDRSGYAGTVVLGIHTGRYCMNYGVDGNLQLAPSNQPAATCEQIGAPIPMDFGVQQSVGFANVVASATRSGQLRIETVSHGAARPVIDYPFVDYSVTAGEWNAVAARNQRITVELIGDASDMTEYESALSAQIAPETAR